MSKIKNKKFNKKLKAMQHDIKNRNPKQHAKRHIKSLKKRNKTLGDLVIELQNEIQTRMAATDESIKEQAFQINNLTEEADELVDMLGKKAEECKKLEETNQALNREVKDVLQDNFKLKSEIKGFHERYEEQNKNYQKRMKGNISLTKRNDQLREDLSQLNIHHTKTVKKLADEVVQLRFFSESKNEEVKRLSIEKDDCARKLCQAERDTDIHAAFMSKVFRS